MPKMPPKGEISAGMIKSIDAAGGARPKLRQSYLNIQVSKLLAGVIVGCAILPRCISMADPNLAEPMQKFMRPFSYSFEMIVSKSWVEMAVHVLASHLTGYTLIDTSLGMLYIMIVGGFIENFVGTICFSAVLILSLAANYYALRVLEREFVNFTYNSIGYMTSVVSGMGLITGLRNIAANPGRSISVLLLSLLGPIIFFDSSYSSTAQLVCILMGASATLLVHTPARYKGRWTYKVLGLTGMIAIIVAGVILNSNMMQSISFFQLRRFFEFTSERGLRLAASYPDALPQSSESEYSVISALERKFHDILV